MPGWIIAAAIGSIVITALLTFVLWRMNAPALAEEKRKRGDGGDGGGGGWDGGGQRDGTHDHGSDGGSEGGGGDGGGD